MTDRPIIAQNIIYNCGDSPPPTRWERIMSRAVGWWVVTLRAVMAVLFWFCAIGLVAVQFAKLFGYPGE